MIGLVLVSHSAKLAAGVAELAAQMGGEDLRIGVAGGLDLPGEPLGTDAVRVAAAIDEVWSPDGVLVLMDLGSAVLSAETALELLSPERRDRVLLTEAPLVEGAVAAAVAAALGGSLETAAAEARAGLATKAAHLAPPAGAVEATAVPAEPAGPTPSPAEPAGPTPMPAGGGKTAAATEPGDGSAMRLVVGNRLGLHARPAALLVRTAARFDADVAIEDLTTGRGPASARSLNAVVTLGVRGGHEIAVRASGPQAAEALEAVASLAEADFGDPPEQGFAPSAQAAPGSGPAALGTAQIEEPPPAPAPGSLLRGLPGSPGIAVGPARLLQIVPPEVVPPDRPIEDPDAEWAALQRALTAVGDDVRAARAAVAGLAREYDAAIFDAHLLLLDDEALLGPAHAAIFSERRGAAAAWSAAVQAAAASWAALDDPYLAARAADVRDVGDQVQRRLAVKSPPGAAAIGAAAPGPTAAPTAAPGPAAAQRAEEQSPAAPSVILVAPDLSPAQIAGLDRGLVRGVACAFGGPTSHAAILARALGVPAVVACGRALLGIADGTPLVLDGEAGTVAVAPPETALHEAGERLARRARDEAEARVRAHQPAVTRDGVEVDVAANVAAPGDLTEALEAGADGVGLLRTEFLFLSAGRPPSEDEQERVYRSIAEGLGGRRLVLRTLDAGADKPLAWMPPAAEGNPFLGLRGIRLSLAHPELLATQLRAALRVSADHPVSLLFPMVSTVDELRQALEMVAAARESLTAAGVVAPARTEVGVMVEVPAAALAVEAFVPHVDFFSMGTNDLAQYVLAADRGNAGVAALADALHPAVLSLIDRVVRAAVAGGRRVSVCGELAGDPPAIPLLLGLGITELSMAPPRLPAAKEAVRRTDVAAARRLAGEALRAGSAAEVRVLAARAG